MKNERGKMTERREAIDASSGKTGFLVRPLEIHDANAAANTRRASTQPKRTRKCSERALLAAVEYSSAYFLLEPTFLAECVAARMPPPCLRRCALVSRVVCCASSGWFCFSSYLFALGFGSFPLFFVEFSRPALHTTLGHTPRFRPAPIPYICPISILPLLLRWPRLHALVPEQGAAPANATAVATPCERLQSWMTTMLLVFFSRDFITATVAVAASPGWVNAYAISATARQTGGRETTLEGQEPKGPRRLVVRVRTIAV